jgi:hypothetical protein
MFRFILGGCAVLRYRFGERGIRQINGCFDNICAWINHSNVPNANKNQVAASIYIYEAPVKLRALRTACLVAFVGAPLSILSCVRTDYRCDSRDAFLF